MEGDAGAGHNGLRNTAVLHLSEEISLQCICGIKANLLWNKSYCLVKYVLKVDGVYNKQYTLSIIYTAYIYCVGICGKS